MTCYALMLSIAAGLIASDPPRDDASTKVIALLRTLNDAYVKRDRDVMDRLMGDDHVAILGSGQRQSKAEHLKVLADLKLSEYTMADVQSQTPSKDVVIITYGATVKGSFNGEKLPSRIIASSVWTTRNGKWQEVFYQETVVVK